jgi:3-hydroxyisobutyrate dehydrogenase
MKVGFIGLGMQGKYMAVNLAEAGYDLMVYDTRSEPLEELARAGAKIARSNAEVAKHAEIVQVCVLNDAQVEAVVAGPKGLLETAAPGAIIVIHSTIAPATLSKLAPLVAQKRVEIIDAPVSGSEGGAREMPRAVRNLGAEDPARGCARRRSSCQACASNHHHRQHAGGLRGHESRCRIRARPEGSGEGYS